MPKILQTWTVQPHGALIEIDDGILTVEGTIVMPLGNFPRRMTVVRLAAGGTAIWSAIALAEPEMARIEALGAPKFLIVPNAGHRLDARIWKQRYPDLTVIAPPGARDAVAEAVPVDATSDAIGDEAVSLTIVAGTAEGEFAMIVRRAGDTTLVTNDIIGHVVHPRGIGAKIMARLLGYGIKRPQVPRMVRRMWIKQPAALAAQMRDWAALPGLTRIIVSHGDPIDDPRATLLRLADGLDG